MAACNDAMPCLAMMVGGWVSLWPVAGWLDFWRGGSSGGDSVRQLVMLSSDSLPLTLAPLTACACVCVHVCVCCLQSPLQLRVAATAA